MAITVEANYSKKLGLPGYSSNQYSVTVRSDSSQTDGETASHGVDCRQRSVTVPAGESALAANNHR